MARVDLGMSILDLTSARPRVRTERLFSKQVEEARRFVQGPPRRGSGNIVVIGGFERVDRNYSIRHRKFPLMAVEFVVGGRGEVRLSKGRFKLTPGTIFSYSPKASHDISTDLQHPLAKYFVSLAAPAATRLFQQVGFETDAAWQTSRPADLQRLFDELLVHGSRAEPVSRPICDQLLHAILLLGASSRLSDRARGGEAFDTYERCCKVLDEQAMRLRTINDLARRCGISVEYLCRLFKKYEGQSPYQRLVRARMNAAAARLRSGNVLIKDIAAELGFADAFHFSRVFKRVFGSAPASMRGGWPSRPE